MLQHAAGHEHAGGHDQLWLMHLQCEGRKREPCRANRRSNSQAENHCFWQIFSALPLHTAETESTRLQSADQWLQARISFKTTPVSLARGVAYGIH